MSSFIRRRSLCRLIPRYRSIPSSDSFATRFCRNKKSEAIGKTQPRSFIKASQQATRGDSRRVRDNGILKHFIDEFSVTGVTSS
jgi:hypothetical protein